MMTNIRQPAVSSLFYPADPVRLRQMVTGFLADADAPQPPIPPKAIIAPHAGYIYSGPIAGAAFKAWHAYMTDVQRVVIIGPAHTMTIRGLATVSATAFRMPFGDVLVDRETIERLRPLPQVQLNDNVHIREHALEVMLPFLQIIAQTNFTIVPILVGQSTMAEVATVLEHVWGGPETRLVISSDLSHYHDYATAKKLDAATAVAIEQLQPEKLSQESACGRLPIQGLLQVAQKKGLQAQTIDCRNSGDTAGTKDRVVGYGAFWISDSHPPSD